MQARSQARKNALPGGQNVPELPLEVIQNIFTLSVPLRPDYRARFDFLLPLCLVHRSLSRSVQRILFADVCLSGIQPIRRFIKSLELVPEFKRWVKTLELGLYGGDERDIAEVDDALSNIVEHCIKIEEVEICVASVNLALFAQLKHLRQLKSFGLDMAYFEPILGKSRIFESLVSLSFIGGRDVNLRYQSFFTPEVLPSLRRLTIDGDGDRGPIDSITDLYDIANQLRHLSLEWSIEDLDPLLARCKNLLSLSLSAGNTISSANRFSKPLVAIRLWWTSGEQDELDTLMEMLRGALSSGLIAVSSTTPTVIFGWALEENDEERNDLVEWCKSVGLPLEYKDGALEEEWQRDGADGGYSRFTEWVDAEVGRREIAADESKRQR